MKTIILIISLLLSVNIFGDLHFGVKAGVNYNDADIISPIHGLGESYSYDINYSGGIFLIKELNEYFYISIEGLINNKGFELDDGNISQLTATYMEFPLLLGIKYNSFYIYSGLYYAKYLYSSEECKEGCSGSNNGIFDSELIESDTGIIIGAGYNYKRFLFDLRYSKGITEINEMPGDREYSSGIDNFYQFIFSVGFMFK